MPRRTGAGLVSYSPEQETRTWWERALIPFVYTRLAQKFSYDAVNDPDSPAAAASGQYLLIRREDYERIGGHAAVAGEVLEDVALARLAKQAGIRLHFASGHGIMRVRMYRTFGAMWQGWTKNLYPLMGGYFARGGPRTARSGPLDTAAATSVYASASNNWGSLAWQCWQGATRHMRARSGEIVFRRCLLYTMCQRLRFMRRRFLLRNGAMRADSSHGKAANIR